MEKIKNLVVGCGFSGATMARQIAEVLNEDVVIIDKKNHIAGNSYDYFDENNICVHQYGTHIFHTGLADVWHFLSRFTDWHPYFHHVLAYIDGMQVPIPFNLSSIRQVFPQSLANRLEEKLISRFGYNVKVPILSLKKEGDPDLEFLANFVYEKVFLNYTLKQWGVTPEELDPAVTGRVPVYVSKDNRYFQDKYQGIPLKGFTALIRNMLDHPRIHVELNKDFNILKQEIEYERIFYTGSIDEFFDYKHGELPYRSIRLDFRTYPYSYFQENSVINYPNNYDFTRIGEYKYFLNDLSDKTVVSFEYPQNYVRGQNDPYYPIVNDRNKAIYDAYLAEAQKQNGHVYFLGRLGDYKYYDMDKAVNRALELFDTIKEKQ